MSTIHWAFLDRDAEVTLVGPKVAYSWTCDPELVDHTHTIECLWVWHDCDHNLDPERKQHHAYPEGWTPSGVGLHDLISIEPLRIEASVYWPACCGMHGWISNGQWTDA